MGPDVDLQILTRSVSGVTLTTQRLDALELQAKLMQRHGTTWDRNFDYMNDVENLVKTAILYHEPRIDADEEGVAGGEGELDLLFFHITVWLLT